MKSLLSILNDIPANTEHFRLVSDWREYQRNHRRCVWNSPSAREEAGRCLMSTTPWEEYDLSAPRESRCVGYWKEVAGWLFFALSENMSGGAV